MPIEILERSFQNLVDFNISTAYKANAGDVTRCSYKIIDYIEVKCTGQSGFSYDFLANKITSTNFDFLAEGFQIGDSCDYAVTDVNGIVQNDLNGTINQGTCIVTGVTVNTITLSILEPAIGFTDTFTLTATGPSVERKELHLLVNHKESTSLTFDGSSHIDGELTQFQMLNPQNLPTPVTITQFGNESGQFEITNLSINKPDGIYTGNQYVIGFDIIQSGIYSYSPFQLQNYLNLSTGFKMFRLINDPNTATTQFDEYQSNTGWFDEGFNDEPNFAVLDSGISQLFYNQATTGTFQISAPTAMIGMGASYVPTDFTYYLNKAINQSNLGMTQGTKGGTMVGLTLTGGNPFEASNPSWTFVVNSVTGISGGFIVNYTFTPNFGTFFDNRLGDRLFYIWAKVNNVNVLVFKDQLSQAPIPDEILYPDLLDVSDFTDQSVIANTDEVMDLTIEDNASILAIVPMLEDEQMVSFDIRIFTENATSGQQYNLQFDSFNMASSAFLSGAYVQALSIPKAYNLASGSVKNIATLTPTSLSLGVYSLNINYPFLVRWQDWITAIGAPVFFFNNNTQNWLNYTVFGWSVKFEIAKNYGTHKAYHVGDLVLTNYDSDVNVTVNTITLKRSLTGQTMANVIDEPMQITIVQTAVGTLSNVNVEVTVEPFEGAPRWQLATNYANANPNNPLTLVSSNVVGNTVTTIVNLDTTKLSISGGISITGEIKGKSGATNISERHKEYYGYLKLPPSLQDEDRGIFECCEPELKLASLTSDDKDKNDVTGIAILLGSNADNVTAKLYKNGVFKEDYLFNWLDNQLAKTTQIEWKQVLTDYGAGCYEVIIDGTISGISYNYSYQKYILFPYNALTSKNQFRLRCYNDKYSSVLDINFEGSGFYDDIRYKGSFGQMQPKTVVDNLVYADRTTRTIINENIPTYILESKKMKPKPVRRFVQMVLDSTTMEASDYNAYSPDDIKNLPVTLPKEGEGAVLEYLGATRDRIVNITLQKKVLNDRMFKK